MVPDVTERAADCLDGIRVGVGMKRLALPEVEGADVVETLRAAEGNDQDRVKDVRVSACQP